MSPQAAAGARWGSWVSSAARSRDLLHRSPIRHVPSHRWLAQLRHGGEDKTKIVHVEEGFSFLGCDIRRYVRQGGKLLIKPSQESVKRFRERLAAEVRFLRGANAAAVVARLNPVVRGWSAYYRSVVSSQVFARVDYDLWPHLAVGMPHASEQIEALGCRPVLR